ncbi:MAG: FlgD immunoglobulin-like domain containing protein, partial [Nitrosomonadaceae bacterium]
PFNPETVIQFDIPTKAGSGVEVELKIYNILGKLVYTLVDELKRPGHYTVIWNGRYENGLRAASGVYLFQLKAGDFVKVRKMLLLK